MALTLPEAPVMASALVETEDLGLTSAEIIRQVFECRKEAEDARKTRLDQARSNFEAYLGKQDFSGKIEGQSTEFIPKTSIAVEQLAAFVRRALTQFGDWFQCSISEHIKQFSPLSDRDIVNLINYYLNNLPDGQLKFIDFSTRLSDGIKCASLESLLILKVYGLWTPERKFVVEKGEPFEVEELQASVSQPTLTSTVEDRWRLQIDLVKMEDYYPDPTGNGLYEIHRCERDFHDVWEKAEAGIYDIDVVRKLELDVSREEENRRIESKTNQDRSFKPTNRKKVVIDEFWGSLLDNRGRIIHRNVICAIANDKHMIRAPEPNPFWHSSSPFVVAPLVRVPHSVWHRALYDDASSLNLAFNELFNLMLDGGISSVWGVKEVRQSMIENAEEISKGIPQGKTIIVKDELPAGTHAVEMVAQGQVPTDSLAMLNLLNSEFTSAALTNQLRLGQFPERSVLATEVVELSQSQSATLDAIAADLERGVIEKIISKSWMLILQFADSIPPQEVVSKIGPSAAFQFMQLSPEERFATLGDSASFTVTGLTAVLQQSREFQKVMALLQVVMGNPLLLQAFIKRFSADRTLNSVMKMLNINPQLLEKTPEELKQVEQEMNDTAMMGQAIGGRQRGMTQGAAPSGRPDMPAQVNQQVNPLTGMTAIGG